MSDYITFRGFVATDVKTSTTPGGVGTASFRLGSTARRFDRDSGSWVDGHTNWFSVQAYRQLAGNMACSIKKGQKVIVVGRLKLRQWEKEGRFYHSAEIEAESVGHDLMWGSANYIRTANSSQQSASGNTESGRGMSESAPADPEDSNEGGGGPVDPQHLDDDAAAEILLVDDDGSYMSVDAQTGELAESAV